MIYSYKGIKPVIDSTAYVHPMANVTGNVVIGAHVYIGPGACLRGDIGSIMIKDGCNVQENCVIHMFPGLEVVLFENAHVGHGAIIHGATLGTNCLIGMNAVVMDNVVIGENSILGALSFVKAGMVIPPNSLVVGNPAKVIRQVSDEMIQWKTRGTELYQKLAEDYQSVLEECEALEEVPEHRQRLDTDYEPWAKAKK